MSEDPAKEHYLVCPDLGTDGLCLDHDTQARCLQYIARYINTIAAMPPGAVLEVISLR